MSLIHIVIPSQITVTHKIELSKTLSEQFGRLLDILSQDDISADDKATLNALAARGEALTVRAEALDAQTPAKA